MYINFVNNTEENTKEFEKLIKSIFKQFKHKDEVFSIVFVSQEEIREVNKNYRNIDKVTDVISFALCDNEEERMFSHNEIGDILICLDRAREQAKSYNHSVSREVGFLAVHGYLHLCGYDHMTKEDEQVMFKKQKEILEKAGLKKRIMDKYELIIEEAKKARLNAYSPYSEFKVGAALMTKDGKIYHGCNVENISYGLTNCAERTCLFSAVAAGVKKEDIVLFCVVGQTEDPISPCGACRQVMAELLDQKCEVVMANLRGKYKLTTVEELLPFGFKEIENVF